VQSDGRPADNLDTLSWHATSFWLTLRYCCYRPCCCSPSASAPASFSSSGAGSFLSAGGGSRRECRQLRLLCRDRPRLTVAALSLAALRLSATTTRTTSISRRTPSGCSSPSPRSGSGLGMSSAACAGSSSPASSASGTFIGTSPVAYHRPAVHPLTAPLPLFRNDLPARPADPDPFGLGLDVSDVRVAWDRATGRSFGSICLGAAISGCLLGLKYGAEAVRRVRPLGRACIDGAAGSLTCLHLSQATAPSTLAALPPWLSPMGAIHPLSLMVVGALEQMNSYVLVFVGISGRTYKESTLAVGGLVRRRGREAGRKILDCAVALALCVSRLSADNPLAACRHPPQDTAHFDLARPLGCGRPVRLSLHDLRARRRGPRTDRRSALRRRRVDDRPLWRRCPW
jgi:hypothetical protein